MDVALGEREGRKPRLSGVFFFGGQQPNHRVEIIVKETMVTDAEGEAQDAPLERTIDG